MDPPASHHVTLWTALATKAENLLTMVAVTEQVKYNVYCKEQYCMNMD